ncbi:hypothetical protein [Muricoccus radiodurans]|uniref:hypothetical protein n=1 Tax=Muricoccus radiodurans TaxID=2231721 RepID=UPI003CF19535
MEAGRSSLRRVVLRFAAGLLLAVGVVAARLNGALALAGVLAAAMVALALAPVLAARGRIALGAGLGCFLLIEWGWPDVADDAADALFAIVPAAACALAAWHFGSTLRPGREPLIVRYTRFDETRDPAEVASYARGLTGFWAGLLAASAVVHLLQLLPWAPDDGVMVFGSLGVLVVIFLAEHAVRSLRFRGSGIAWPTQTLRAMLRAELAERARHAG